MRWYSGLWLSDSMGPAKRAAIFAAIITLLAAGLFLFCYWIDDGLLPLYRLVAWPGVTWAQFFSAELDDWPKLVIVLVGQFLFCFIAIIAVNSLWRAIKHYWITRKLDKV